MIEWWKQPEEQERYRKMADAFLESIPPYPSDKFGGRGVVIVGGGNYFAAAYVTVRILRHVGCNLPVEMWCFKGEINEKRQAIVEPYGVKVVSVDRETCGFPFLDHWWKGWQLKSFAMVHSEFEEMLFLDADSYPTKNPEFMFDWEPYIQNGAVFFPNSDPINPDKWRTFGVYPAGKGIESGEVFLNKRQCWREINLTLHYNRVADFTYRQEIYGDQETLNLGWQKCGTPVIYPQQYQTHGRHTIFQHGPDGSILFNHRFQDKAKLGWERFTSTIQISQSGNVRIPSMDLEDVFFQCLDELKILLPTPDRIPLAKMKTCPLGHAEPTASCPLCWHFWYDPDIRRAMESAYEEAGVEILPTRPQPIKNPRRCIHLGPVIGEHVCTNGRSRYPVHDCPKHGKVIESIAFPPDWVARSCHACPDHSTGNLAS